MTAAPVVPTLQDPTTGNRPPGALFGANCERRAKVCIRPLEISGAATRGLVRAPVYDPVG